MIKGSYCLTGSDVEKFSAYLLAQEKASSTIQKYTHDLNALLEYLNGGVLTKEVLLCWKEHLTETLAPASVNSMLAAVNGFFIFMGWRELLVKPLKIQKCMFREEQKELTFAEYTRLVEAAKRKGNRRLVLVLETICSTGIRVSELRFITAEAVGTGRAEIVNKGKRRLVFLPEKLCKLLKSYLQKQKITAGAVFVTKNGKPLDRSNIWRDMKKLCESAGVEPSKVFPHNLRHLFARTFYSLEKDLSRLADILGHSSVNTTRIYTMECGNIHARQVNRLGLVLN